MNLWLSRPDETAEEHPSSQEADADQQDMPQVRVDRKRKIWVMQAAGIGKDRDAAQESIAHEKYEERLPDAPFLQPGVCQEDVHGDAAQLKWKIPPVILTAADVKCQSQLFPYFADKHQDSQEKKEPLMPGRKIFISKEIK